MKYYYNSFGAGPSYIDLESLDSFINKFWEDVISFLDHDPNLGQEAYVSFTLIGADSYFFSKLMILRNDARSLHMLRSQILNGVVGSSLKSREDTWVRKCYFTYKLEN
jgi:hypothetical protein